MKADGNPANIAYTWTKDGLPVTQAGSSTGTERIISDGSVLNITRLSRHDAGSYSCEALNSQGSTLAVVNVTVQCNLWCDIYNSDFIYLFCYRSFINSSK